MRSAILMFDRRWATMRHVRVAMSFRSDSSTLASVAVSKADVASSRTTMGAGFSSELWVSARVTALYARAKTSSHQNQRNNKTEGTEHVKAHV